MRHYQEIYDSVVQNGKIESFEARVKLPKDSDGIRGVSAERWLEEMAKSIFQAGFRWQLIEDRWSGFIEAFEGFDLFRLHMMPDEELERIARHPQVVANMPKIKAVQENATALLNIQDEFGSVGGYFANWTRELYCVNLADLRKRTSRLGGRTGQMVLRRVGVDTMVFSDDVISALARDGVIDKMPTSKIALQKIQDALDIWCDQGAANLNHLSLLLALSD